jgi:hypothetical protein
VSDYNMVDIVFIWKINDDKKEKIIEFSQTGRS